MQGSNLEWLEFCFSRYLKGTAKIHSQKYFPAISNSLFLVIKLHCKSLQLTMSEYDDHCFSNKSDFISLISFLVHCHIKTNQFRLLYVVKIRNGRKYYIFECQMHGKISNMFNFCLLISKSILSILYYKREFGLCGNPLHFNMGPEWQIYFLQSINAA